MSPERRGSSLMVAGRASGPSVGSRLRCPAPGDESGPVLGFRPGSDARHCGGHRVDLTVHTSGESTDRRDAHSEVEHLPSSSSSPRHRRPAALGRALPSNRRMGWGLPSGPNSIWPPLWAGAVTLSGAVQPSIHLLSWSVSQASRPGDAARIQLGQNHLAVTAAIPMLISFGPTA